LKPWARRLLVAPAGYHPARRSMPHHRFLIDLDRVGSSYLLLLAIVAVGALAGLLFRVGVAGRIIAVVSVLVQGGIRAGFRLWVVLLSWAPWPAYLALVVAFLLLGLAGGRAVPWLNVACALVLLFLGVTACLAYMFIDVERYEVARGYKALHNPLKGQELAVNLIRFGTHVGVPLLASASVAVVLGFALLNE